MIIAYARWENSACVCHACMLNYSHKLGSLLLGFDNV